MKTSVAAMEPDREPFDIRKAPIYTINSIRAIERRWSELKVTELVTTANGNISYVTVRDAENSVLYGIIHKEDLNTDKPPKLYWSFSEAVNADINPI